MSCTTKFALFAIALCAANQASAATIADYNADFAFPAPAAGWAYMRNPLNVNLNAPAGWVALQPDTGNLNHYGADNTTPGWPDAAPGSYTIIAGATVNHPGQGSAQATDQLEHYGILSYTLGSAGDISITDIAANVGGSNDGTHLVIGTVIAGVFAQVSDLQIAPNSSIAPAAIPLGILPANTQVIVALGPNGIDGTDATNIEFKISAVPAPEPAGLFSLCVAGAGLACQRRRIQPL